MPREGHDLTTEAQAEAYIKFLSTCPVRGTTINQQLKTLGSEIFLSTCPVRGTTSFREGNALAGDISIHVPREGHDHDVGRRGAGIGDFYPRAP